MLLTIKLVFTFMLPRPQVKVSAGSSKFNIKTGPGDEANQPVAVMSFKPHCGIQFNG